MKKNEFLAQVVLSQLPFGFDVDWYKVFKSGEKESAIKSQLPFGFDVGRHFDAVAQERDPPTCLYVVEDFKDRIAGNGEQPPETAINLPFTGAWFNSVARQSDPISYMDVFINPPRATGIRHAREGRNLLRPHGMSLQEYDPPARNFIFRRADQDKQDFQDNQDMAIAGGSRSRATAWECHCRSALMPIDTLIKERSSP